MKKSTLEAKNSDVVVDVASFLKDVEASTVNIASPYIMKKDEPIAKWLRPLPLTQLHSVPSSNVSTFELLSKLKCISFTPPPTSSWSTSSKFIFNNSFVRMVEEKQRTSVWP
jgi:hypothetical protein